MDTILLIAILVLLVILIVLVISKGNTKTESISKTDVESMIAKVKEEMTSNISNNITESSKLQQNLLTNISSLNETKLENVRKTVDDKFTQLQKDNTEKLEQIRGTVDNKLTQIQKDNSEKLEQMRVTVDEKLHKTLEERLGESFKLVNDRLESVYKGLGEMQTLAQGVGDLKKVFSNVKSRGYWGEVQLHAILEQFLTSEQYSANVKTKEGSNDLVEFAIKLPGKTDEEYVYLPVDSKFPIEDFQKLITAEELGDINQINESRKGLENSVKSFAKDIYDKYIDPPHTTDFGIMFLPTESLYCEVLKNTTLCEQISQKYRIVVSGPTTFVALLNSLQMGFKTLAIEKRSSEVWQLLGMVKSEFSKFGDLLDKTNKQLQAISNTMSDATRKTRTIERKLKNVQALPVSNSTDFYEISDAENLLNSPQDED